MNLSSLLTRIDKMRILLCPFGDRKVGPPMAYRTSFWDTADGTETLSQSTYSVIISLVVTYGLALSGLGVYLTRNIQLSGTVGALAFCVIMGMAILTAARHHPIVTWFGYTMMALLMGAISGPFVAQYTAASALRIFALTGIITLGLGFVGVVFPRNLRMLGSILMTGLLLLIIAQFSTALFALMGMPVTGAMRALDWVGIALFSVFLIYDFNQAYRKMYNVDNAFNAGVEIYLDFINIFIRLLSLFGQKKG